MNDTDAIDIICRTVQSRTLEEFLFRMAFISAWQTYYARMDRNESFEGAIRDLQGISSQEHCHFVYPKVMHRHCIPLEIHCSQYPLFSCLHSQYYCALQRSFLSLQ